MADFLIISLSGRSLAESAKRAGHKVCVADCFADVDTSVVSDSVHQLQYSNNGFNKPELINLVKNIKSNHPNIKLVLASGIESSPDIIQSLNKLAPVISNTEETIAKIQNPSLFFSMLNEQAIGTPQTSLTRPNDTKGYLIKKIAGAGGSHIQWADQINYKSDSNIYYQEYVSGVVFSVVFIADGKQAKLIGFNQQLQTNEFSEIPFLYQGAIRLNQDTVISSNEVEEIVNKITKSTGLKGLCGLDYIVTPSNEIIVLEVNPRPPSTFELHENNMSLFDTHIRCFDGNLTDCIGQNTDKEGFRAYAILYAKEKLCINDKIEWPDWIKDRPKTGSIIKTQYPVCTVHAKDISLDKVKTMLFNRLLKIETMLAATQNAQ